MTHHDLALVVDRPRARPLIGRGYQLYYHPGEANHCPGCGREQWFVGRITAECAFCATALTIARAAAGADA